MAIHSRQNQLPQRGITMKSNKQIKLSIELVTGFGFYSLVKDLSSPKKVEGSYKLRDKGKPVSIGVVSLDASGNIQAVSKG